MTAVVPVANMVWRMPGQGRIRLGAKGPKGEPRALGAFRLTSSDEQAIREVAQIYGGEPQPWKDAPTLGQWQVTTDARELAVALPPDPLGGTPCYELWSRGGLQRRCDGDTCTFPSSTPDGAELATGPCICAGNELLECKPTTRLAVILTGVRFGGTWMVEAHGWNAFTELPGMVETIRFVQARGIVRAVLAVENRQAKIGGRTKNYVVPVLRLADSADALAAGAANLGALAPAGPPLRALQPGELDDEPTDADLVLDASAEMLDGMDGRLANLAGRFWGFEDDDLPAWFAARMRLAASARQWTDDTTILEDWWHTLNDLVDRLESGRMEAVRTADGRLTLRAPQ